jgi:hypothetical protein
MGFLCLTNVRYWPVAATQAHEIVAVRAAAIAPKRTVEKFATPSASQAYCVLEGSSFGEDSSRSRLWACLAVEKFIYRYLA